VHRLRQLQQGRSAFTQQLMTVQLEAADILRAIRSGILTIDPQGRLLYANPMAAELLGLDLERLLGRPVLPAIERVAPELAQLLADSSRHRRRVARAEGVIRREGGEVEVGMTTTVAEVPGGGARYTTTAIFQDISDSKRLQALHVRTERLQAVAELSASLAHEIRNPLASIRSATEQLARRRVLAAVGTEEDEDGVLLHTLIVREADRLSRLLGDFLDFARAQVSRLALLDIGAVARGAAELAAAHPERPEGVQLAVEVTPGLPLVEGDEDLLHRAVFNLVLNAVQAVEPGGHVWVRVEPHDAVGTAGREVPDLDTPPLVAVSITDDGPGIPPELRTRLFEPFVSGKPGGTGLGLPVVHRAAEAHRGLVLVDALPRGTRFTLFLPASPTRRGTPGAPTARVATPLQP
jgi:two-component system sensor histidine kinase PilS (NtrC family)